MVPDYLNTYSTLENIERIFITDIKLDYLFGIIGDSVIATQVSGTSLDYVKYKPFEGPNGPHILASLNSLPYLLVS